MVLIYGILTIIAFISTIVGIFINNQIVVLISIFISLITSFLFLSTLDKFKSLKLKNIHAKKESYYQLYSFVLLIIFGISLIANALAKNNITYIIPGIFIELVGLYTIYTYYLVETKTTMEILTIEEKNGYYLLNLLDTEGNFNEYYTKKKYNEDAKVTCIINPKTKIIKKVVE